MSQPNNPNPYAPPVSRVDDASEFVEDGALIRNGRTVPAGNGASWLGAAWRMFKENPGSWLLLLLVYVVIVVVLSIVPFVNFVLMIAGPVLYGGVMYTCDQQRKNGKVEIADLFAGFRRQTGPLFVLGALYLGFMVICFVLMLVVAGSGIASAMFFSHNSAAMASAFAGPGFMIGILIYFGLLVLAMAAMWFAPTLVMLHGIPPVEALKISFVAAFRNFLPGLVYSLLLLGLFIVAAIPLLLGYFIVIPMFVISFYTAYRDIFIEA